MGSEKKYPETQEEFTVIKAESRVKQGMGENAFPPMPVI